MEEQLPPIGSLAASATPSSPSAPSAPLASAITGHRVAPAVLWAAVLRARADLARQRHLGQGKLDSSAQAALLEALESYVKSLLDRGHPVPYALRDELRLHRLTGGAGRRTV